MTTNPGYESLAHVLQRALDQAQSGKGAERHANQLPFDQQPMQTIAAQVGVGFLTGQAIKKTQESQVLVGKHGVAELLGAINYLAGAVIFLERQSAPVVANDNELTCNAPGSQGKRPCPQCVRAGGCIANDSGVVDHG